MTLTFKFVASLWMPNRIYARSNASDCSSEPWWPKLGVYCLAVDGPKFQANILAIPNVLYELLGINIWKVVPDPSVLVTSIDPLHDCTIQSDVANPKPVPTPSCLVV